MQTHARAVIIGAGIAGASIAYHLARLGWREIVVVEQGELVSGTTSHAPGLVGQLRSSVSLTKMLLYSVSLYRQLSAGGTGGYIGEGSLRLASSRERWAQLQEQARFAQSVGLEAQLLGPSEAGRLFPLLTLEGVEGALYLPADGSASASILARALIQRAQTEGVLFLPQTRVQGIEIRKGRVAGLVTRAGRGEDSAGEQHIDTEIVVVAAGIWSPLVGSLAGVALPLTPMQHQYAMTAPLPQLAGHLVPNLRDPDKLVYLRQREQSLVFGGYERNPRVFAAEAIPHGSDPTVRSFDAAHFESLRRATAERVPVIGNAELIRQVNGLEAFTPDGEFLLGPATAVKGFWAACGFCAHGISGAGGVGKVLAEWLVNGDPGLDLSAMSLERFAGQNLNKAAIQERACQLYRSYYDIHGAAHS